MRSAILLPLAITSAAASVPCTSEQACRNAAAEYSMSFRSGNFRTTTKGCFTKGGTAYWSPADTYEEMAAEPTPSLQERLYCDSSDRSGGGVQYCTSAEECEASSYAQGYESFAAGDWKTTKVRTIRWKKGKSACLFPPSTPASIDRRKSVTKRLCLLSPSIRHRGASAKTEPPTGPTARRKLSRPRCPPRFRSGCTAGWPGRTFCSRTTTTRATGVAEGSSTARARRSARRAAMPRAMSPSRPETGRRPR